MSQSTLQGQGGDRGFIVIMMGGCIPKDCSELYAGQNDTPCRPVDEDGGRMAIQ